MKDTVRRIVTSQAPDGRAKIASDGEPPGIFELAGGFKVIEIWKAFQTPVPLTYGDEEPTAGQLTLEPPANGHLFRITEFPPDDNAPGGEGSSKKIFEQMGAEHTATMDEGEHQEGLLMHRTETLDYGIVLEGSITLVLDDEEVELAAGDIVVQRGSNHAWSNRSGKVCRMAFVLIDAAYPEYR